MFIKIIPDRRGAKWATSILCKLQSRDLVSRLQTFQNLELTGLRSAKRTNAFVCMYLRICTRRQYQLPDQSDTSYQSSTSLINLPPLLTWTTTYGMSISWLYVDWRRQSGNYSWFKSHFPVGFSISLLALGLVVMKHPIAQYGTLACYPMSRSSDSIDSNVGW